MAAKKPKYQHSYSKLDLSEKCPGAFYRRYIERAPQRLSLPRDRGSLVHAIAAEYMRQLVSKMSGQDVELMKQIAREKFHAQTDVPSAVYSEVMDICESLAVNFELDWIHVSGIEKFFTVKIGPYTFRGLTDLMLVDDRSCRIVDWKTPHQITSQYEIEHDPQLRYYALSAFKRDPELEFVHAELFFARQGISRGVDYSRDEVEELEEELLSAINALEAREAFPFTPGSFCGLCDYTEDCLAVKEALESGAVLIATAEDAAKIAGDVTVLDRRRKDRMAALKQWATTHGPVRSGDLVYGHSTVSRSKFDARDVAKALKKAGIDPFEALRVDGKALDQAVLRTGTPELAREVAALAQDDSYSMFRSRKFREEAEA